MNDLTEAQLADYYNTHGVDDSEWEGPLPLEQHTRREVTLSVRFSEDEINALRQAAQRAGAKPTAFIRAVALAAISRTPPPPSEALSDAINSLARDLERLREVAQTA